MQSLVKSLLIEQALQHIKAIVDESEKTGAVLTTDVKGSKNDVKGYTIDRKARLLDRWLDAVVRASGSEIVFFTILAGIFAWAFLGISFHDTLDWQVLISDIQAILSYMFDSLLMPTIARIEQPQDAGHIMNALLKGEAVVAIEEQEASAADESAFKSELPEEDCFGRFATNFSFAFGHIGTIVVFWLGTVVWLAFGPTSDWSNLWQLNMNSATSALMVLIFAFLANIRERHSAYTKICLDATFRLDSFLERKLRLLTGDKLEKDVVVIPPPKFNALQRAIYYYADVVGTLVGIAVLLIVMVVWVAIGPLLQFSDNWWLLIGTYAGLVGLNDGFVLRNVQAKLRDHQTAQFEYVDAEDEQLFTVIHQQMPAKEIETKLSISSGISLAVGRVCAHEITVLVGVIIIFGLLAGSSAMKWNTTGQLICNVPPSIIESFLMIILITGHNFADAERRVQIRLLYERRLRLVAFVSEVEKGKVVTP
ncbi:hypothetical protein LTR87_016080 [Friedmanniomyces endolithicus]|nr:hypothetical protein LTR87_016080 [Friedmanniomyces endolithicus]